MIIQRLAHIGYVPPMKHFDQGILSHITDICLNRMRKTDMVTNWYVWGKPLRHFHSASGNDTSELFQPQADNAFRGGCVGTFGVNEVETSATHTPSV